MNKINPTVQVIHACVIYTYDYLYIHTYIQIDDIKNTAYSEGLRTCKSVKIWTSTCITIIVLSHISCVCEKLKKKILFITTEHSATNIRTLQEIGNFNGLPIRMSQFFQQRG
jgi:hypothetical protein